MKNPFLPLAERLYRRWKPFIVKKQNQKVCKELQQLYPLENMEKLHDYFQVKRLAVMFMIVGIGIASAICLYLSSRMEGRLAEGTRLFRNEWNAGDYHITLIAEAENWNREIPFLVEARKLSREEQEALQKNLYTELPDLIKNDNTDLEHVVSDLHLPVFAEGYPFRLTWDSSNKERIDRNGKINRKGMDTKETVSLTVTTSYGQEKNSFTYELSLLPEMSSEEERFFRLLEDLLCDIDLANKGSEQIILPDRLDGKAIAWKEGGKNYTVYLLFLTALGCVIAAKGMEKDLEKDCKKRNKQLLLDYPGFVNKLRLYISAGLSVQNAFYRIMKDYENTQKRKRKYLYEEMKISCCQLENGVMEEQVYREFGKRCGEMRYRRLSFLLAVHLKQGNGQLLTFLSEEAEGAQEDRRNMARKAGEEASTRLLFPMMLMLVVVMFLVMLPAYLDFGSI
ncbi:MAG: hypothetical protein K2H52_08250 [Lachnospiraceae bacterium]|nr:hypothetical protein [Lachnospiraceae bacterium]MDE6186155.1 hypothetical protein [Lachnospiraceae bacterium]